MNLNANQEFSTFDVMKIFDIKRGRLREWMHYEYVPVTRSAEGPGTKNIFSLMDLYNVSLFKELLEAGMNRSLASTFMKNVPELKDWNKIKKQKYILFIKGEGFWIFRPLSEGTFDFDSIDKNNSQKDNWKVALIINFTKIMNEVDSAIKVL